MESTTPLETRTFFVRSANGTIAGSSPPERITISCYPNRIPAFVKPEMERLYQSTFASVAAEHVDDPRTSTYVVCNGDTPITIILFRHEGSRIRVFNATILLCAEDIQRFAEYVFDQYRSVSAICFQSIRLDGSKIVYPHQRFNMSEDIVLTLPQTGQEYLESLGKSTRKYIKYHLNRRKRHLPTYAYRIYEGNEINDQIIDAIIDLNTARMLSKHKESTIDESHRSYVKRMVRVYGFVGAATIDGRICAGVICSRVGGNYFLHVIAHDPHYNDFRLGTLFCYSMICEAIARGGREFHFLWGHSDYKYRLLGVRRDLEDVTVYRSKAHCLRNMRLALSNVMASYARQLKLRLEREAGSHTHSSRTTALIVECLHAGHWMKQHIGLVMRRLVPKKKGRD